MEGANPRFVDPSNQYQSTPPGGVPVRVMTVAEGLPPPWAHLLAYVNDPVGLAGGEPTVSVTANRGVLSQFGVEVRL
jgi:hypothetical protein